MSSRGQVEQDPANRELWHTIFSDGHPLLLKYQRWFKRLPSPPRCKLCSAPFGGLGGVWMRARKRGRSGRNPHYCNKCDEFIAAFPGGAEVELSMVFVDVRGSTALAEQTSATEYSRRLNEFYSDVANVFVATDGFMMDVAGDEVFAVYPPGFSGKNHAKLAIEAAGELLRVGRSRRANGGGLPFGIGVHTGVVYIGTISGAAKDIAGVRAIGDGVNTAARLCSEAVAGEALLSEDACTAAALDVSSLQHRHLELKGKSDSIAVRVMSA